MSATYYHYTVWAEKDDGGSSGQRVDPREAFDNPFLQEESDSEDETDIDDESGAEATGNQESIDQGTGEDSSEEGDRIKLDGEIYFFVFDQIFPETDDGTTQTAFYGKGQRNRENRRFEAEIGERVEQFENLVDLEQFIEQADQGDVDQLEEPDVEDWSAAIPEDSAARMGVLYGETEIHLLIEQNSTAPGIDKTVAFLTDHCDDEYTVRRTEKGRDFSDEPVTELLNAQLQTATLSFKYHPSEHVAGDDADDESDGYELDVDESLAEATPENYRLKYEIAQERGDTETERVRDVISDVLGIDGDELEDALTDPDIRNAFHKLRLQEDEGDPVEIIFTIDEDGETVDDLGDEFVSEELGERLVELIRERITDDGDDSETDE